MSELDLWLTRYYVATAGYWATHPDEYARVRTEIESEIKRVSAIRQSPSHLSSDE